MANGSTSGNPARGTGRPTIPFARSNELRSEVHRLDTRIDDEIRGLRAALEASIVDEVARLDMLNLGVSQRLDAHLAYGDELEQLVRRVSQLASDLDVRIQEAAELAAQPHAAERLSARKISELEERIARLEATIAAIDRSS